MFGPDARNKLGFWGGITALLMGLLAVFLSFWSATDPVVAVIYEVAEVPVEVEPLLSEIESPSDVVPPRHVARRAPDPAVRAERLNWYDEVAADATAIVENCGVAGLDVACEGDVCAVRHSGKNIGKIEHYREYTRQPMKAFYETVHWAGYIEPRDMPCPIAHKRIYLTFSGAWTVPGADPGHKFCAAHHRLVEHGSLQVEGDRTGERLCNRLASARDGPDAAIYLE